MKVEIKNNKEGVIPKGSIIIVEKILKNEYKGIWSSSYGTYTVTVKKCNCKKYTGI